MLYKVKKYIENNQLLDRGQLHLVALSGGPDSVCLFRMMIELGYNIHAMHCNFHLRGKESARDELFCQQLCEAFDIPLHLTHFDTKIYAKAHKISIEMAARELRYGYFESLRQTLGAASIVVAHHRDDNVETVLMNIIRGTGIHGIEGIKPRNGFIIRPLLCLSRKEITEYLALLSQSSVTDSSNLIDDVTRNKIRIHLIPLLENINPAAITNITRTIQNVAESIKIIDVSIEKYIQECLTITGTNSFSINKEKLLIQPAPEQILFAILSKCNFNSQQIRQIYENVNIQSGKIWSSFTHTIASDRGFFLIDINKDDNNIPIIIPETGLYAYNNDIHINISISKCTAQFAPSKELLCATLDADKVHFPLQVRRVQQGDRFSPFGMKGTKLVSDYLTDRKRNYFQRKQQLLVEDADGNIIWLIGERISQKASCTANTIKILTLRYMDKLTSS